jgi:hypothetical protein
MSKPFQFSMRGMFILVTILCVELGLWTGLGKYLTEKERAGEEIAILLFVGSGAITTGIIRRNPLIGALVGLGFLDFVKFVYVIQKRASDSACIAS